MEKILEEALSFLEIKDAVWTRDRNDTFYTVCFPCEGGETSDTVLDALLAKGIGQDGRSTIGILPCPLFFRGEDEDGDQEETSECEVEKVKGFKSMQQEFLKSVTARLTVAQVVKEMRAAATLTFDYVMFVVMASAIAAAGLAENNVALLVASMLISPIMGPIVAGTFGAMIRDTSLRNMGIQTGFAGVMIALIFGFLFSIIGANFGERWAGGEWPTTEMASRGHWHSLWVGIIVALPSGVGVAISVLGGNTSGLVGAAISISLLPPTVNTGMLMALSLLKTVKSMFEEPEEVYVGGTLMNLTRSLMPPNNGSYEYTYFIEMHKECAVLGGMSFLLLALNVLCIIVMAVVILKVKEVIPKMNVPETRRFWNEDIKIARDYNRTVSRQEGEGLARQLLEEWANLNGLDPKEVLADTCEGHLTQIQTLQDLFEDVEADQVYQTIMRQVAGAANPPPNLRRLSLPPLSEESDRPTAWELESDWKSRSSDAGLPPRRPSHQIIVNLASPQQEKKRRIGIANPALDVTDECPASPVSDTSSRKISMARRPSQIHSYSLWPASNPLRKTSVPARFVVMPADDPQHLLPMSRRSSHRPSFSSSPNS